MLSSSRSNRSFKLTSGWGVVLLSVVGAALASFLVWAFWPSTYTASSSFFVSTRSELLTAMAPKATPGADGADQVAKPTQDRLAAILSSRLIRSHVATRHGLAEALRVDPAEAETMLMKIIQVTPIGEEGFTITATCRGYSAVRVWFGRALPRDRARQMCADLANSYLSELQTYITTTTYDDARKKREFLQTALGQVDGKLKAVEGELRQLQQRYELTDPEQKAVLVNERIKALEQAEAEALSAVKDAESSLTKASAQLRSTETVAIARIVKTRNPLITGLEEKLAQLQVDLATQEAMGKTRQNRDVAQIVAAIDGTRSELARVSADIRTELSEQPNPVYDKLVNSVLDLQVAAAGARARQTKTAELLKQARATLQALPPIAQRYVLLKQDQTVQLETRSTLKQALAIALIQERQSKQAGEFLVLDQAAPPPDLHRPPVALAAILTLAILLSVLGLISLNRSLFGP